MKKVHPLQILNNTSLANFSTDIIIPPQSSSALGECRFCKKILTPDQQSLLVLPCGCRQPIHKPCIPGQLQQSSKKARRVRSAQKQQRYNCPNCAQVIRFLPTSRVAFRSCREIGQFGREHTCMCLGVTIGILLIFTMVVLLVILKSSSMQISDVLLQSSVIGCAIALAVVTLIVMYLLVSEVFMKIEESVEVIGSSRNGKGCQGQGIRKENGRERKGLVVEECA